MEVVTLDQCKVYILEDDFFARDSLGMYCAKSGKVSLAGSGELHDMANLSSRIKTEALSRNKFIVIISTDSVGIIQQIVKLMAEIGVNVPFIVLTKRVTSKLVTESLNMGVSGILQKDEIGFAIAEAVTRVGKGYFVISPKVLRILFDVAKEVQLPTLNMKVLCFEDPHKILSPPIMRTMQMFCLWGMSKDEVAVELGMSPNTIASRLKTGYLGFRATSRSEVVSHLLGSVSEL